MSKHYHFKHAESLKENAPLRKTILENLQRKTDPLSQTLDPKNSYLSKYITCIKVFIILSRHNTLLQIKGRLLSHFEMFL